VFAICRALRSILSDIVAPIGWLRQRLFEETYE
jgi:hypothetical protein